MNTKTSKRTLFFSTKMECREEQDGTKHIKGIAVPYGQQTELWTGNFELFERGSLAESLEADDVRVLYNHNPDAVLARKGAGTVTFEDREQGVFVDMIVNEEDTEALNIYARVKRGDIPGWSIGFISEKEDSEYRADGSVLNKVKRATVVEFSVCPFPAYSQTEISARKADSLSIRKEILKKRLEGIK